MSIKIAILGATGSVGQMMISLLDNHPWFEISSLCASKKSAGKIYSDAANWYLEGHIPESVAIKKVEMCEPDLNCDLVLSALDSNVAGTIEEIFAKKGYFVISNAKNYRMKPDVPIVIPEVNSEHLKILTNQNKYKGYIVTNPNCSTTGIAIALKPIFDDFGISKLYVVTMQALSGAGYNGIPSLKSFGNVIPFISEEENKIKTELNKIFGKMKDKQIDHAGINIGAQCNRVPVIDGHIMSVKFEVKKEKTSEIDIVNAFKSYNKKMRKKLLPSSPEKIIEFTEQKEFPQPRLHKNIGNGMTVSIGKLKKIDEQEFRMVILVHNTIRGAAGGAILNAECCVNERLIERKEDL